MEKNKKIAVALKYPDDAPAPFVVAKGTGKLAEYIIAEAKKNDVNIVQNQSLVNILNMEDLENYIPEAAWKAVASIFAFMYEDSEK